MRYAILGALVMLLSVASNANAVAACINDQCTPTLPYATIPLVPTQQVCVWANDEPPSCVRLETDQERPTIPGNGWASDHLSVCWSSAQFACKRFDTLLGTFRYCIQWNDYAPSCFTVSDAVNP